MTDPAESRTASNRRLPLVAVGLIFLLLVGSLAGMRLHLGWLALTAPGSNTVGEAGKVYFAKRFQDGQKLFLSGDQAPFYPSFHGALLHASVGAVGKLTRASTVSLYYIGRSISVACTFIALGLCVVLLRRWGASAWWVIPLVLVFLATRRVTQHTYSYRPDNWLLMLSVLSCFLVVARAGRRWSLVTLTITPVLAFFVKATGAVLLPTVVLGLLVQRRFRDAVFCAVAGSVLMATSVALVDVLSDGAFLSAMRNGAGIGYSLELVFECLNVPLMWLPLLMPAFLLHRARPAESGLARERAVVSVFWLIALVLPCFTSSRLGSNSYYFLEAFVFGMVLTISWLADVVRSGEGRAQTVVAGLILLVSLQAGPKLLTEITYFREHGKPRLDIALDETLKFHEDREKIVDEIDRLDLDRGRYEWACLSDDSGLNVLLDEPAMVQPLLVSMMIEQGLLDEKVLIDPIQQRRVARIVLTGRSSGYAGISRIPESVMEAIKKNYGRVDTDTRYTVLAPIPRRPHGEDTRRRVRRRSRAP